MGGGCVWLDGWCGEWMFCRCACLAVFIYHTECRRGRTRRVGRRRGCSSLIGSSPSTSSACGGASVGPRSRNNVERNKHGCKDRVSLSEQDMHHAPTLTTEVAQRRGRGRPRKHPPVLEPILNLECDAPELSPKPSPDVEIPSLKKNIFELIYREDCVIGNDHTLDAADDSQPPNLCESGPYLDDCSFPEKTEVNIFEEEDNGRQMRLSRLCHKFVTPEKLEALDKGPKKDDAFINSISLRKTRSGLSPACRMWGRYTNVLENVASQYVPSSPPILLPQGINHLVCDSPCEVSGPGKPTPYTWSLLEI